MLKNSLLLALVLCLAATAALAQRPIRRELDVIVVLHENVAQKSVSGADVMALHAQNRGHAAAFAAEHGVAAHQTYGTVLRGFAARVSEAQLAALRDDPRVARVEYDGMAWAAAKPGGGTPAPQETPWGIARVGADTISNTGAGVHVYVLDSGIDADHPDLAANISTGWAGYDCKGGSCAATWDDDYGHGTHVAGTIGAINNDIGVIGVAPDVILHSVKVLHKSGSGAWSIIAAGVDWAAADMAARGEAAAANMSIGGVDTKNGTCTDAGFTGTGILHEAMCNARNMGLVMAVAAGNSGADAETNIPAAYDDCSIIVSATLEGDDWVDWSNWGDEVASWTSNASAPVAIAAPGVSVLSTYKGGGTSTMSGTSMATPHVAGAIALYLATNSQAMNSSAFTNSLAALLASAEGSGGFNNTSGHPHAEDFLDVRGF
jgi:subtilisin